MTRVSATCLRQPVLLALSLAASAVSTPAWSSDALARKHACAACHQAERKVVGPPWKDIAARYGDGRVSAAQLAAAVRQGGSGKWGPMAMPPQAQVPEADLQQLAIWVLGGGR